jgi:hypothetical protein
MPQAAMTDVLERSGHTSLNACLPLPPQHKTQPVQLQTSSSSLEALFKEKDFCSKKKR